MSEWQEIPLGEVIDFTTGKLNSNAAVTDGKYPFFTCSPETLRIDTYAFDCKAILLAGNNANGQYPIKIYNGKFNAYQRTYVITPKNQEKIDLDFLYYLLSIRLNYFKEISQGSATKFLTAVILKNLALELPCLIEQKEISAVLVCLDRAISNLRQQNETLEQIAQTLFKHWFVDFEFPDADGKPYKSAGGEMVRSELGEIPKGWCVKKIENVIDVRDGTHESPKQTKEGFHLITSKHLKKEGIDFETAYLISESDYTEANKRSKVDTFDILVSMIGTVGLLYFVMEKEINFAIKNIGLFKTSKNQKYAEFIFLFLTSIHGKTYFRTRLGGTTQSFISLSSLREMNLLIPDELLLLEFQKVVKSTFNKSYANSNQIQTLTKTRNVLLPQLMSGKLRITES